MIRFVELLVPTFQKLDLSVPAVGHTQDHRSSHSKSINLGLGFSNVPSPFNYSFPSPTSIRTLKMMGVQGGFCLVSLAGLCATGGPLVPVKASLGIKSPALGYAQAVFS